MTFLSSDPFQSVSDFFGSGVWTIALVLIQVFAAALWLALAYWVYQDARRRFENSGAITACVAIALIIPFLGALVYLFIRPPEYLTDAHDRELETLALESQVEGLRCACTGTVERQLHCLTSPAVPTLLRAARAPLAGVSVLRRPGGAHIKPNPRRHAHRTPSP